MALHQHPIKMVTNEKHQNVVFEEKAQGEIITELVRNGSIELSGKLEGSLDEAVSYLPYRMSVYTPSLPKQSILAGIDRLRQLHEAGFDPVPHLAARNISSTQELTNFLQKAVQECGVHRVLLVGGDVPKPLGPYADSAAVLREGILEDSGITEVGIAAYPEGHHRIPLDILRAGFEEKLQLLSDKDLAAYVITQFSFAPVRIVDCCTRIAQQYPEVPVYIGMAGPTPLPKLIRYAKHCGVSTSLRALSDIGFKAVKLISHEEPDKQLSILARYCTHRNMRNVMGIHVFSFGGFLESAHWMYNLYAGSH